MYEVKISCVLTIKDKCKQEKKVPNLTILIRIHDTQREDFFFNFKKTLNNCLILLLVKKMTLTHLKKKIFRFKEAMIDKFCFKNIYLKQFLVMNQIILQKFY